jgi:asparagine synthase (glutamine-hydrolysing)
MQAEGSRVLLTGEGGDEWMNGSLAHWPDLLGTGRWGLLLREGLAQWPDEPLHVRLRRTGYHSLMPLISRYHRDRVLQPSFDVALQVPPWIRPDWAARIGLVDRWRQDALPIALPGLAQQQRYGVFRIARRHVNVEPYLAHAEHHGVEVRHPLHDLRLTRFFMGAAGGLLRKDGLKKHVLREAMRGTLPELVRTRTSKAQFMTHMVDAATELFRQRPPGEMLVARLGWVDSERLSAYHAVFQAWREAGPVAPVPREVWNPVWFALAMDMWLEHAFKL